MLNFVAIMDLVKNHPYFATFAIGVGTTILASAAIWRVMKVLKGKKKPFRINEVVIFNELSEQCVPLHYNNRKLESVGSECYLKCDNPYCSLKGIGKMVQQIDQALYAADAAIYTFTSIALCEAFQRALQRGVTIRIIADREMVFSSGSQLNVLADLGAQVRGPVVTTHLMHHKFLVIDGVDRLEEIKLLKRRKWLQSTCSVLISGSVNWTRTGFSGNWENCIITDDKMLAHAFQAEFNRMWKAFERFPDAFATIPFKV